MDSWTPFVICYLLGVSTPIALIEFILRRRGDKGSCLTEFLLFTLACLIVVTLLVGLRSE